MFKIFFISILLIASFIFFAFATDGIDAQKYDGLWFMGFNLTNPLFKGEKGLQVRKAVNYAIRREKIALQIASSNIVPDCYIPYGMEGYQSLDPVSYNIALAKQLLKDAGYSMQDKRLKKVRIFHTNGIITKLIAKEIQENLKNIGIKVILEGINFSKQKAWVKKLKKKDFDLFLMGYKADIPEDVLTFLNPIFYSVGDANFTGLNDKVVDDLLDSLEYAIDSQVRLKKIKHISEILMKKKVIIGLFYIPVL